MARLFKILAAVAIGFLGFWLVIALLGFALRLVALAIAVGLAVVAYFVAERLIGRRR